MAKFQEHISQAKRNLLFLQEVNGTLKNYTDWQVTACFYSALHFLNAYLAKEGNLHYNKHKDMENALNWSNPLSILRLTEVQFTNYQKLRNLSRRSRYLCTESGDHSVPAQPTQEKQIAKAIVCLDKIIDFFLTKYSSEKIDVIEINCPTLVGESLKYFKVKSLVVEATV